MFWTNFIESHRRTADKRLNVSDILPFIKVSWKQCFELFNELRFTATPFDKWFRFHGTFLFVAAKVHIFFEICKKKTPK